jgi:hypothetical protein
MGVSEVIHKMRAKGVRRMPIVSEREIWWAWCRWTM